ncbi:hypothetical protein [Rubritalea tangerina]|uniref:hypothetical protein n=1 Tax=Rubritalea tangerina TaxID=430798 RepID=UPI00360981D6
MTLEVNKEIDKAKAEKKHIFCGDESLRSACTFSFGPTICRQLLGLRKERQGAKPMQLWLRAWI